MRSSHPVLLWIDDFELGLTMYKAMFEDLGFHVLTASCGRAGLALMNSHRVDIVVTDYEMAEMDGEAIALAVKTLNPKIPVVLFSGSTLVSQRALRLADACCDKASPRHQLLGAIHRLLQKKLPLRLQPPSVSRASEHGQRTVA